MDGGEQGRSHGRNRAASRPRRAPAQPTRVRRRWLWRTFLLGVAVGLVWAGWNQAVTDVRTIRQLFGF